MQKLAIFSTSHKGGVGKTTLAKALLDALRRERRQDGSPLAIAAYDTDPEIGQLARAYGIRGKDGRYDALANNSMPFHGVAMFDARSDPERFVDALDGRPDAIIFDLPGGLVDLKSVLGDIDSLKAEFESEGFQIVVLMSISHVKASAEGVAKTMALWGPGPRFIVAKNLACAGEDDFIFFDGELAHLVGYPSVALASAGGIVMQMPALDPVSFSLLDAEEIPFSKAPEHIEASGHELRGWRARRGHIRKFVESCDRAFAAAGLLPSSNLGKPMTPTQEGRP